jgi:hypothetical protein
MVPGWPGFRPTPYDPTNPNWQPVYPGVTPKGDPGPRWGPHYWKLRNKPLPFFKRPRRTDDDIQGGDNIWDITVPHPWDTDGDGFQDLARASNTNRDYWNPNQLFDKPTPRDPIVPLSIPVNTNPLLPPGFGSPPRPWNPTSVPNIPDMLTPPGPPGPPVKIPPIRPSLRPDDFRIGTDGSRVNPRHSGSKSAYLGNQANPRKGFMYHWKSSNAPGKPTGVLNGVLPTSFGKVSSSQAYSSSNLDSIGAGGPKNTTNIAIPESRKTMRYGKARKLISEAIHRSER